MPGAPPGRRLLLRTGVALAFDESPGADPPLLLLHAWAESRRAFDRLLPLLPTARRVLAPDLRGHGESDKPDGGYSLDHFAEDVVAFLDEVEVASAVLVGASSGGYVAQQVAMRWPERVAGLVLVGAPRSLNGQAPGLVAEWESLTDPIDRAWAERSLERFPLFHRVPHAFLQDRVDDIVRCPARAQLGTLTGLLDAVPPTEAGVIDLPTTIVWGERDDILPAADAQRLQDAIAGSRLVVLPDTGHAVLWEQPGEVAKEVADLLARLG